MSLRWPDGVHGLALALAARLVIIVPVVFFAAGCGRAEVTPPASGALETETTEPDATTQPAGVTASPPGGKDALDDSNLKPLEPATEPAPATATNAPPPPQEESYFTEREDAVLSRARYRDANGPPVFAYALPNPPTIDGLLDEWNGHVYDVSHVVYNPDEQDIVAGDLSGRFYCGWDTSNFYLAIDVSDDVHIQSERGALMYQGDDIELQIDAELEHDFDDAQLSDDDGQIGLSAGDFGMQGPEGYIWRPPSREQAGTMIAVAARERAGGYALEAAIPWWVLGGRPAPEMPVGFSLSLSDSDTPGAAQQDLMVSNTANRAWSDPTTWGTLILVDWQ